MVFVDMEVTGTTAEKHEPYELVYPKMLAQSLENERLGLQDLNIQHMPNGVKRHKLPLKSHRKLQKLRGSDNGLGGRQGMLSENCGGISLAPLGDYMVVPSLSTTPIALGSGLSNKLPTAIATVGTGKVPVSPKVHNRWSKSTLIDESKKKSLVTYQDKQDIPNIPVNVRAPKPQIYVNASPVTEEDNRLKAAPALRHHKTTHKPPVPTPSTVTPNKTKHITEVKAQRNRLAVRGRNKLEKLSVETYDSDDSYDEGGFTPRYPVQPDISELNKLPKVPKIGGSGAGEDMDADYHDEPW